MAPKLPSADEQIREIGYTLLRRSGSNEKGDKPDYIDSRTYSEVVMGVHPNRKATVNSDASIEEVEVQDKARTRLANDEASVEAAAESNIDVKLSAAFQKSIKHTVSLLMLD